MPEYTDPDRPHKRDATRQRLLDAANRRFREHGYEQTTATAIADDAGVTERTFFRHFASKADVLVANWQLHGDALRHTLEASTATELRDVVRDALLAFTDRLAAEMDQGLDSVRRVFVDSAAFLAIMRLLLDVEQDLAVSIGRRSGQSADAFHVRVAANASIGVLRAAVRAHVLEPTGRSMAVMIADGIVRLGSVFDALEAPPKRARRNRPRASE